MEMATEVIGRSHCVHESPFDAREQSQSNYKQHHKDKQAVHQEQRFRRALTKPRKTKSFNDGRKRIAIDHPAILRIDKRDWINNRRGKQHDLNRETDELREITVTGRQRGTNQTDSKPVTSKHGHEQREAKQPEIGVDLRPSENINPDHDRQHRALDAKSYQRGNHSGERHYEPMEINF